MRKLIIAILLSFIATAALAQTGTPQNKSAIQTEITANFPDNSSGLITPLITRTSLSDFLASWQNQRRVNAQVGTTYTYLNDDNGKLVTYTSAAAVAVTLPQATTAGFVAWESVACNLGAGAVTITPATSTINGNATLVLGANACASIVSDGTNYQVEQVTFAPGVNAQVGTTYTVTYADFGKLVTFTNGSPVAVTVPQATGLFKVFFTTFCNKGTGLVTVTPTTSTINGVATLTLPTNVCSVIFSDGTNYQATPPTNVAGNNGVTCSYTSPTWTCGLTAARQTNPTIQTFTTAIANQTYTTPANVLWIEIAIVGGGGGGGGGGTTPTNGIVGGDTCWNTSGTACTSPVLRGSGGGAGSSAGIGSSGGAATGGNVQNVVGGYGTAETVVSSFSNGGNGGNSIFGGGGAGAQGAVTGAAGAANSGGGGGGGGDSAALTNSGGGGGAGGGVRHIINSPAATYTYTVGGGGTGGGASTNGGAGGAGGSGVIIVIEHYGS